MVHGTAKGALSPTNFKMHLLRAFFVLTAQYCFYYYLHLNTLLNAVVLLNLGPLFIPIIEWGILRHKVGKSTWIGIVVSFIGMLCVIQPDKGIFSLISLIGILAGVSQGASQVVMGINSKTERSDLSVLYLFFICMTISAVPYLFIHGTWLEHTSAKEGMFLVFFLAVASIANQLCRAMAYQHGTPSMLSSFLYFSVLVAGIVDWAVFDTIPNFLSAVGACLVVLGGVLKIYIRAVILGKKRSKSL